MRRHIKVSALRDMDVADRPLAVIRPEDPEKALALVDEIMAKQKRGELTEEEAIEAFDDVPTRQQYRFVGYLGGKDRKEVVDEHGKVIGKLQRGDSFVDPRSLSKYPPN